MNKLTINIIHTMILERVYNLTSTQLVTAYKLMKITEART